MIIYIGEILLVACDVVVRKIIDVLNFDERYWSLAPSTMVVDGPALAVDRGFAIEEQLVTTKMEHPCR